MIDAPSRVIDAGMSLFGVVLIPYKSCLEISFSKKNIVCMSIISRVFHEELVVVSATPDICFKNTFGCFAVISLKNTRAFFSNFRDFVFLLLLLVKKNFVDSDLKYVQLTIKVFGNATNRIDFSTVSSQLSMVMDGFCCHLFLHQEN